jgi:Kef-type K+ transport system membrane component KefB
MVILMLVYRLFRVARRRVGVFMPRMSKFLNVLKGRESLFAIYMIFVLAFAGLAELLGLHFVIGAFFGTILIPRELFPEEDFESVKKTTQSVTMGFLSPIFFTYLGLLINFQAIANPVLLLVVILAAFSSKVAGGYIGGRFSGMGRLSSFTLGIGINTKGIMELVIASIAYQKGFIDLAMFTILVLMAIITTVATPFLLKFYFGRMDRENGTAEIFIPKC